MTATTLSLTARRPAAPRRRTSLVRLALLELRLLVREPMVMVSLIGFPLATVLVLAGVFGQAPDPDFGGVRPDDHYIAGYIGVVLAALGLLTLPVHLANHRERGVLRRYRAAGVSGRTIVASNVILGVVLSIVSASVVVIAGAAVYRLQAPEDPLTVMVAIAVGLVCFISIGVALGSVMPTSRAANAVGNLIFVPAFLLGGGGPPTAVMTGPMQTISEALPLTHVIGGIRQGWFGETDDPHQLWWPLVVAAVSITVALRGARRSGLAST